MSYPNEFSTMPYYLGQPVGAPTGANLATLGVPVMSPNTVSAAAGITPAVTAAAQPNGGGAPQGLWGKLGGMEGLSTLLQGIGSLGSIYTALQGIGIAKDQLAFSKEAYRTNLANTTKSYNTALEDRIRSRYVTENRAAGEADSYIDKHKL